MIKCLGITQKRCDVFEQNPPLGEIGHVPDVIFEVHIARDADIILGAIVRCSALDLKYWTREFEPSTVIKTGCWAVPGSVDYGTHRVKMNGLAGTAAKIRQPWA
jgi:hypothetical protein